MRKFKVNCIQISGVGQLLFNHGDECTEEQLDNLEWLLKDGAISEVVDKKAKAAADKAAAKAAEEAAAKAAEEAAAKAAEEAAAKAAEDAVAKATEDKSLELEK